MFEQVFDNLQKATESTVKMQQEMIQKWVEAFPATSSAVPNVTDAFAELRQKWEEVSVDLLKRQKEMVDRNYEAGLKSLKEVFDVADAKSPEEYQQKVTELYSQSFESMRQLTESQMNELKAVMEKWSEMATPKT
jgi:hypothetical protein